MGLLAPRAIYLIVLIEGYIVLATELLAIRLLVPFVGSGTEIVAILVGGVLLPLAAGYATGSHHNPAKPVRHRLLRNAISALGILALGLSYPFLEVFFGAMDALHWHRLLQTTFYVLLFLIYPIYLLAQTVPLVSHYFRRENLSRHTGRMLFYSTAGSFLGSILSTLVLMSIIGVHGTVIATLGLLLGLVVLLAHRRFWFELVLTIVLFAIACALNHPRLLATRGVVSNNAYNLMRVTDIEGEPGNRALEVNRSTASKFTHNAAQQYPYIAYLRTQFIEPLAGAKPPRDILVLGAGGFTVGLGDATNRYDYVDIDPAMQRVAEQHFLKAKLPANQRFHAISARAFLRQSPVRYDLIIVDVYSHVHTIPAETTTVEFLQAVKDHLKPGGIVAANVIASAHFNDRFTQRYTNGFAKIFPRYSRQIIGEFNGWNPGAPQNLIYIYFDGPADGGHYTDDKNTYFLDRD